MKHQGLIFNITQYSYLSRPLGGHRIASFLRQQEWDIEVVDWANWWQLEELKVFFVSRYSPCMIFVGFSHLFSIWPEVMENFAAWIKTHYPDVKLISGSSVNPMFQTSYIDWYIQGFGEYAILALLKYLASNGPSPRFNFLGSRKVIPAIDYYPAFPMKSLMVKYEDRDFIQPEEWLTIELSRGCKFQCAFCQFPVLGMKQDTTRDAEDFQLQLKDAHDRFGVTAYMLADETANDSLAKITKFADAIEDLDFLPWFSAYLRLDLIAVHPEQKQELLRMNVLGHFYGIESMNTKSARSIGKGLDSERIKNTLLEIKQFFLNNGSKLYRGHVGLIAGLPFETEQTLQHTTDWLVQNWQGQSFGIHHLYLPRSTAVSKQSDMSKNIMKYGYREMTDVQIYQADISPLLEVKEIQKKGEYTEVDSELFWQNNNMNIFDAQRIVRDIYRIKKQHDFRPGCFMINYKLQNNQNVEQRLRLSFEEYDNQIDFSVQDYINKKIS